MSETIDITVGHNQFGFWCSRRRPIGWRAGIIERLPVTYLHPDGVWRTAAVMSTGERGYFETFADLAALLRSTIDDPRIETLIGRVERRGLENGPLAICD